MTYRESSGPPGGMSETRRTFWRCRAVDYGGAYGDADWREVRERVESEDEAILVASLTESGDHAPALDLDFPARIETLAYGRSRLILKPDRKRPRAWKSLLARMAKLNLLRRGFERDVRAWVPPGDPGALTIELAVPARLVPSSTPEHFHLYLEARMPWRAYLKLCKAMAKAGLLEREYVAMAKRRGMTMLFKPGLTKAQLADDVRWMRMAMRLKQSGQIWRSNGY